LVPERRVDLKVIEGRGPAKHEPHQRPPWARRPGDPVEVPEPGMRPVDLLLVGYLLLTAVLLLAFPRNVPAWPLLLTLHLVAVVAIFRLLAWRPKHRLGILIRDWYPIPAFAPLYSELGSLTNLLTRARYDRLVAGWEQALFRGQPSQTLRLAWTSPILSEYVHFSYFFYYFVPTTLAIILYARGDRERFSRAMTATLMVFLACCLIYIMFPVVGPYHHFGHAPASAWPGFFAPLVHSIVQRGSSLGTAFPSSHTAVAVCVWLSAWRLCRPAFYVLTLVVPTLALGTVYGGFHYAVDTLAGAALGAACAFAAPALHARLAARIAGKPAPERLQTFASQGRGRHLE